MSAVVDLDAERKLRRLAALCIASPRVAAAVLRQLQEGETVRDGRTMVRIPTRLVDRALALRRRVELDARYAALSGTTRGATAVVTLALARGLDALERELPRTRDDDGDGRDER